MQLNFRAILNAMGVSTPITKVSQLENDVPLATSQQAADAATDAAKQAVNTGVPRYAKQHTTTNQSGATFSILNVVWPKGRFTELPVMPDPTVVTTESNVTYKCTITSCDINGCSIRITRMNNALNLLSLGLITVYSDVTAAVKVNVFATQQTD